LSPDDRLTILAAGAAEPSGNMVVLQRRSRLVTFRLSADEYDALVKSCLESGARSVAEFARLTVLQRAQTVLVQGGTLQGDLATLSKSLGELDATLELARKRIRELLGSGNEAEARPALRQSGQQAEDIVKEI
jgi:hypothetical protein